MATNEPRGTPPWVAGLEGSAGGQPDAPLTPDFPGPGSESPAVEMPTEAAQPTDAASQLEAAGITRLRDEASNAARRDGEAGLPDASADGDTGRENDLRERCRAFYDRWSNQHRRSRGEQVADSEEAIAARLGEADLAVDKFERLTNELMRLKVRRTRRHQEVTTDLERGGTGERGLTTKTYLLALSFLGVVEFFANAPVFQALLPRDVLTERQIRLVTETSDGWFAGAERVMAQLILRPDAALLALGVVTFLCVLAHFFGHSLRELVMLEDHAERHHTVAARSKKENVIPMVLTGVALLFVLGVLFEARIQLGEVGIEQYNADHAQAEEFRREAEFRLSDGNLLEANSLRAQADDLDAAAAALRDYSQSMSRLSFPILLLNLTLVICALCAAYFHRRDHRREHFNDNPFERERLKFISAAEETAGDVSGHLSELARLIRTLKSLSLNDGVEERRGVVRELESVIALYRAENGRVRGVDPRSITAFQSPISLDIEVRADELGLVEPLRTPSEYDEERRDLQERFQLARQRFNEEAISW